MSRVNISFQVVLTDINCGRCGGTYAINETYRAQCFKEGTSWNCPYCQTGWGYSGNGENAKLKKELEEEKARKQAALERANREAARAQQLATQLKGTKTRLKNVKTRVANGICPCCNRTFMNLQRHMHTKHPDYSVAEGT